MSVLSDATELEAAFARAMTVLFGSEEEDPLRHHSVGQIRFLRTLQSGSMTPTALGRVLRLSPSSVTQMASRLILAGLIAKERDGDDGRIRRLSLTATGSMLMSTRQVTRARAASRVLEQIDEGRRKELIELLKEIGRSEPDAMCRKEEVTK